MSPDRYHSFILRLWKRGEGPQAEALLMLEDTGNGERLFFAGVAELAAYLEARVGEPPVEADPVRPAESE